MKEETTTMYYTEDMQLIYSNGILYELVDNRFVLNDRELTLKYKICDIQAPTEVKVKVHKIETIRDYK